MKYRVPVVPRDERGEVQPGGTAVQKRSTSIGLFTAGVLVTVLAAAAPATAADAQNASSETPATARATVPAAPKKGVEPQQPVRVSADAAEYFNKEARVAFTGHVVAVQADSTITAERMDVSFENPAPAAGKPAAGIGSPAGAQRITTIVAEKNVSFRQVDPETGKERFATGDKGVYDVDQRLVTMSGSPRLWKARTSSSAR